MAADAEKNARRKERAALWSVAASVGITVAKGAAGFATGSLALISDAAHSLLDVASTTITWFAVRTAHKPADEEHHYGHGKFESLAALLQTALLFLLSGAVAFEGIRRLAANEVAIEPKRTAVGVLLAAIAVDAWRWWSLRQVAWETASEALDADALHFSSDLINSVLVLLAFGAAALGYPQADSLVAILVSLFIALAGFSLARRTIDTLLDAAPKGLADSIRLRAEAVPGVVTVERVRVRPAGGQVLGEVSVRVPRTLPLESVAAIKRNIVRSIEEELPRSEITVSTQPIALDSETVLDRVMLIAAKRRIPVHHVTVQEVEGRLSISLDLEVDGRMSLGAAHSLASKLEGALRAELGPEIEIDTHIEPLRASPLAGRDEQVSVNERITGRLRAMADEVGQIHDVHSVRVRRTADGLIVNYHCRFDPTLTVADVHSLVDEMERRFRTGEPDVIRLVGHAEPLKRDTAQA